MATYSTYHDGKIDWVQVWIRQLLGLLSSEPINHTQYQGIGRTDQKTDDWPTVDKRRKK